MKGQGKWSISRDSVLSTKLDLCSNMYQQASKEASVERVSPLEEPQQHWIPAASPKPTCFTPSPHPHLTQQGFWVIQIWEISIILLHFMAPSHFHLLFEGILRLYLTAKRCQKTHTHHCVSKNSEKESILALIDFPTRDVLRYLWLSPYFRSLSPSLALWNSDADSDLDSHPVDQLFTWLSVPISCKCCQSLYKAFPSIPGRSTPGIHFSVSKKKKKDPLLQYNKCHLPRCLNVFYIGPFNALK